MKMPTDCTKCRFCDDETLYCWATRGFISGFGNPKYCPLEEVPETHDKRTETHGVCLDAISRQAAIEAFDNLEWFHQNANKDMVSGANSAEHQAWYKAEDVYRVLEQLPSAQPDLSEYSDKLWKKAYERGKAEAQQRWIPCSERLPEPRMAVLGYAPRYQNIYALYYDTVYGWMVWSPIRDDCFPNSQGEIVAWMPLPKTYREEGD